MIKKAIKRKSVRQLISAVLALLILISSFTAISAFAEDETTDSVKSDASFYSVASAAAAYYDVSSSKGTYTKYDLGIFKITDTLHFSDSAATAADAGGMIGFIDSDKNSFLGWAVSQLSMASQTYSYDSFMANRGNYKGLAEYGYYGYALRSLGLDSTATESLDMAWIGRLIGGGLMMVVYLISSSVNMAFSLALKLLSTLNPFRWFANSSVLSSLRLNNYLPAAAGSALAGVTKFVSELYDLFYDMGFLVIAPMFMAALIFTILVFRRKPNDGTASKIKRFVIRMTFIILGIPLLGTLYTAGLDAGLDAVSSGTFSPNYIIASTFVDFENWVENGRLQLPAGESITISVDGSHSAGSDSTPELSGDNLVNVRALARKINNVYTDNIIDVDTFSNSADGTKLNWTAKALDIAASDKVEYNTQKYSSSITAGLNFLYKYASSAKYHSSDFETYYKSQLSASQAESVQDLMSKMLTISSYEGGYFVDSDSSDSTNIFNNGTLVCNMDASDTSKILMTFWPGDGKGLSTLSMYNYLNSTFDDSGITVYSANKSTSGLVRQSHHSVNLVGSGLESLIYYIDTFVMLLALTVIGWGYAFAILFGSLRRGIRMITSVPMAMMGSIKAISRVITIVAMMLVNVVVTLVMYEIVQMLMISLSNLIETPFTSIVGVVGAIAFPAVRQVFTIISIIATIIFVIMAMRLRKKVVRACDEALAGVIDRMFAPSGVMPESHGPGFIRQAAGAVGSGAAMALGSQIMRNAVGGDSGTPGVSIPVNATQGEGVSENSSDTKTVSEGGAVNPSGGSVNELADGSSIQGGERQKAIGMGASMDGSTSSNDEAEGKKILSENAESLGDIRKPVAGDSPTGDDSDAQAEVKKAELAEDMRKDGAKESVAAKAKTVKGVAEAAVGAYTGNEKLTEKGVKDTVKGVKADKDATAKMANADAKADEQVENEKKVVRAEQAVDERNSHAAHNDNSEDNDVQSRNQSGSDNRNVRTDSEDSAKVDTMRNDDKSINKVKSEDDTARVSVANSQEDVKNTARQSNSLRNDDKNVTNRSNDSTERNSAYSSSKVDSKVSASSTVDAKKSVSSTSSNSHKEAGGVSTPRNAQSARMPSSGNGQSSKSVQKSPQKSVQSQTSKTTPQSGGKQSVSGNAKAPAKQIQPKTLAGKAQSVIKNKTANMTPQQKKVLAAGAVTGVSMGANAIADKIDHKTKKPETTGNDEFI